MKYLPLSIVLLAGCGSSDVCTTSSQCPEGTFCSSFRGRCTAIPDTARADGGFSDDATMPEDAFSPTDAPEVDVPELDASREPEDAFVPPVDAPPDTGMCDTGFASYRTFTAASAACAGSFLVNLELLEVETGFPPECSHSGLVTLCGRRFGPFSSSHSQYFCSTTVWRSILVDYSRREITDVTSPPYAGTGCVMRYAP